MNFKPAKICVIAFLLLLAVGCQEESTHVRVDSSLRPDENPFGFRWFGNQVVEINAPESWEMAEVPFGNRVPGKQGVSLIVSTDPSRWADSWVVPGVLMGASRDLAVDLDLSDTRLGVAIDRLRDWLESQSRADDCGSQSVVRHVGDRYSGFIRQSKDCGEAGTSLIQMVGLSRDRAFVVLLDIKLDAGDLWLAPRLIRLFHVQPSELK